MVDQTHNRKQDWEGWPFGSLADAAEFVGELLVSRTGFHGDCFCWFPI